MQALFISDLHLSHHNPKVVDGFLRFLDEKAAKADQLYILGDFFDAWIGDDDDDNLYIQIKAALKKFSLHTPTFFIRGNRDFLIGSQFAEETGIQLLDDITTIHLNGVQAAIMHGDTLCTEDTEYLHFRTMVRSPQWQQQVLGLPLPQRRQMAADLRSKSSSLNAIKAEDIMDVTQAEVDRVMDEQAVTLLIHGHTHRPMKHSIPSNPTKERIVLGDWHDTGWYLSVKGGRMDLVEFEL